MPSSAGPCPLFRRAPDRGRGAGRIQRFHASRPPSPLARKMATSDNLMTASRRPPRWAVHRCVPVSNSMGDAGPTRGQLVPWRVWSRRLSASSTHRSRSRSGGTHRDATSSAGSAIHGGVPGFGAAWPLCGLGLVTGGVVSSGLRFLPPGARRCEAVLVLEGLDVGARIPALATAVRVRADLACQGRSPDDADGPAEQPCGLGRGDPPAYRDVGWPRPAWAAGLFRRRARPGSPWLLRC